MYNLDNLDELRWHHSGFGVQPELSFIIMNADIIIIVLVIGERTIYNKQRGQSIVLLGSKSF